MAEKVDPLGPLSETCDPGTRLVRVVVVPSTDTVASVPVAEPPALNPRVAAALPPVIWTVWLDPWSRVESTRSPLASYPACRTPDAPAELIADWTAPRSPLAV